MTGGLDRQNKPLGDAWILDIERGNWRKVRLNFTLCVVYIHIITVCMLYSLVLNPRRTCAARVTVVVLCLSVCFRGPHLQLTQLSDKVSILAVSVSCSLVIKFGVFRIMVSFRR